MQPPARPSTNTDINTDFLILSNASLTHVLYISIRQNWGQATDAAPDGGQTVLCSVSFRRQNTECHHSNLGLLVKGPLIGSSRTPQPLTFRSAFLSRYCLLCHYRRQSTPRFIVYCFNAAKWQSVKPFGAIACRHVF